MTGLTLFFWLIVDFGFVVCLFWFLRLPPFDRKNDNCDHKGGKQC
ncbi:hypothetical protein BH10PSE18_BH10PSE18_18750 [soil metagenome]